MKRWARIGTLTACVALAFGCDEQTEVQRQTHELEEAQKNVPAVTQELESQLEQARAEVARLEQKVALARQGLTDDVLENQKELQAALQEQERVVETELGQAKREAQIHARDTEAALKALGQTATPGADPVATAPEAPAPEPPPPAPEPAPTSDAPREELMPVRGSDGENEASERETAPVGAPPAPPPAPPQTSSPVADPTGAVPPLPPRPTLPASDGEARALEPSAPAPAPEQP